MLYKAARANGVRVLLDGIDGDHAISHGMARITERSCVVSDKLRGDDAVGSGAPCHGRA